MAIHIPAALLPDPESTREVPEYVLTEESAWIKVPGGLTVHIQLTDEGVVIDIYGKEGVDADAVASAYAFFEEEQYKMNIKPMPGLKAAHSILMPVDDVETVYREAWYWHRRMGDPSKAQRVTLPAILVTRLLRRQPDKTLHGKAMFQCNMDGTINYGSREVWATGGDQIVAWALRVTTDAHLDHQDYVEYSMYWINCADLVEEGRPLPDPWDVYRSGVKMPDEDVITMLQRIDRRTRRELRACAEDLIVILSHFEREIPDDPVLLAMSA